MTLTYLSFMEDVEIDVRQEAAKRYYNIQIIKAYMPEMYGTHHSKMIVLFRHDNLAQVILLTANFIERDWRMSQAIWKTPLLPLQRAVSTPTASSPLPPPGSGPRFKHDLPCILPRLRCRQTSKSDLTSAAIRFQRSPRRINCQCPRKTPHSRSGPRKLPPLGLARSQIYSQSHSLHQHPSRNFKPRKSRSKSKPTTNHPPNLLHRLPTRELAPQNLPPQHLHRPPHAPPNPSTKILNHLPHPLRDSQFARRLRVRLLHPYENLVPSSGKTAQSSKTHALPLGA